MHLLVNARDWLKLFGCLVVIGFASCRADDQSTASAEKATKQIEAIPAEVPADGRPCLIANQDQLRLRDAPGESGRVLEELKKGTRMYDLGEVSDFTTRIIFDSVEYDAPWLRVETEQGSRGWVYGKPTDFQMEAPGMLAEFLEKKRLQALLGDYNLERLNLYKQSFGNISSVEGFASVFRTGMNLRDTLVEVLETKVEFVENVPPPDLFWIHSAFPGFMPQLVAEGTAYYLFIDFRQFLPKARETAGNQDDQFLDLCLMAFPEDSIEYFFPAWTIQTWDYGGHSLLGRGIHQNMLKELSVFQENCDLFTLPVDKFKTDLLNDITRPYVTYWEPQEKILAEVDSILMGNLSLLSEADVIALQTRRTHFEDPDANGIEVNHRSGRFE